MAIVNRKLYVDLNAEDPSTALRYSVDNNSVRPVPPFIVGDTYLIEIIPLTNGSIDSIAATANQYTINAGIGDINGLYAYADNFVPSASYGWTGSMTLDNIALVNLLDGQAENEAVFAISIFQTTNPFHCGSSKLLAPQII